MFIKTHHLYLHRLLIEDIRVYIRNIIYYIFLKLAST